MLSGLTHEGGAGTNGQLFYADFAASASAGPVSAAAGGTTQGATGIQDIDGVLSGQKWDSTHLTFMFPTRNYFDSSYYDQSALQGFQVATSAQQTAARADLAAYAAVSGLSFTEVSASAITGPYAPAVDITIARSTYPGTAYAYYPSSDQVGGDVWLGVNGGNANPVKGNYAWHTMLHELGHSLGLKHGQETGGPANVALPTDHDSMEFSVMTYRAYPGAPLTGYANETYGFAQSLMMDDIAAIQAMYGANFTTHAENTTYSFSPTTGEEFINGVGQGAPGANRVFLTIWDGNGTDTFDFSNYTTDETIDLRPGRWSVLSATQLANLGDGHMARGNVFNALQYNGDVRSLIENAIGGSGNDTIIGNSADNVLIGGAGNDTFDGGGGHNTIDGGSGWNTALFHGNLSQYSVSWLSDGSIQVVDLRSGSPDGTDTIKNIQSFQFADGVYSASALIPPTLIEAYGSTSLTGVGNNFFLYSGGSGPSLKYAGTAVVAGQFGGWTPVGAEQTASGYDVAWKMTGADQYTVWSTDSSGNYLSSPIGVVPGASQALEALEPVFHQDLNGDGVIGIPATVIEAYGSTSLTAVSNNFFLYSGGSGPSLKYAGTAVVAGQFGGWTPIGAEQTASGYDVAWKMTGVDQYTVWSTDSSGNYVSSLVGTVSGASPALKALEPVFHQDLNGDGVIGIPATVIEAFGSTSLTAVGNNFFLYSGGSGPSLKYGGTAVVAGQFGGWTPIGAEQTASGYDVAWKMNGVDQYTVWSTDSSGNYVSNLVGAVSGASPALEAFEPVFHQDLNGDGVIGLPATVIEAFGSTSLTAVGNNFFLYTGGAGPSLKYTGTAVVAGQFGGWTPIGAEQTASGYDVAWKMIGADQYTVWSTDSSGNYVSSLVGVVSGSSPALQALEPVLHQDLNGDGVIGVPQASATVGLAWANSHLALI
ncbi:MAG: M10 family metallopeptidase C-terminal domain-containing protein [Phreatobacter sp.]